MTPLVDNSDPPRIFEWTLDPRPPPAKGAWAGRQLWVGSSYSLKAERSRDQNFKATTADQHIAVVGGDKPQCRQWPMTCRSRHCLDRRLSEEHQPPRKAFFRLSQLRYLAAGLNHCVAGVVAASHVAACTTHYRRQYPRIPLCRIRASDF